MSSTLTIYKDRSWRRILTVRDQAGDAVSLTGATITVRVKPRTTSPDPPTLELTIGAGITLLTQSGATLGQAQLDLSPSDTAGIDAGLYVLDGQVVLSGDPFVHEAVPPVHIPIHDTL